MAAAHAYEFVCNNLIPGCTYVERGDTQEKVLEQALEHLRHHHDMDYIDASYEERIRSIGIVGVPLR